LRCEELAFFSGDMASVDEVVGEHGRVHRQHERSGRRACGEDAQDVERLGEAGTETAGRYGNVQAEQARVGQCDEVVDSELAIEVVLRLTSGELRDE
jgi:hypothetical protein